MSEWIDSCMEMFGMDCETAKRMYLKESRIEDCDDPGKSENDSEQEVQSV